MKTLSRCLLLLAFLQAPLPAQQGSHEWKEIPLQMRTHTDQKFTNIPAGWQVVDDENGPCKDNVRNFLTGVSVYDGNPIECANLIPDEEHENKSKKMWTSIWKLSPVSKDGSWIRCNYAHTRLSLAFQLPSTAKEVRVISSTQIPNNPKIIKVEYR